MGENPCDNQAPEMNNQLLMKSQIRDILYYRSSLEYVVSIATAGMCMSRHEI